MKSIQKLVREIRGEGCGGRRYNGVLAQKQSRSDANLHTLYVLLYGWSDVWVWWFWYGFLIWFSCLIFLSKKCNNIIQRVVWTKQEKVAIFAISPLLTLF